MSAGPAARYSLPFLWPITIASSISCLIAARRICSDGMSSFVSPSNWTTLSVIGFPRCRCTHAACRGAVAFHLQLHLAVLQARLDAMHEAARAAREVHEVGQREPLAGVD